MSSPDPEPTPPDELLTIADVADILRTKPMAIWRSVKAGNIPATKPLGQWLIRRADLDALLAAKKNDHKAAS